MLWVRLFLLVGLAGICAAAPGCVCNGPRRGLPPQASEDFGELWGAPPGRAAGVDLAARASLDAHSAQTLLATARSVLESAQTEGKTSPDEPLRAGPDAGGALGARDSGGAPQRRVMLALYRPGAEPVVVTAKGVTGSEAVSAAAAALAARPGALGGAAGRLELEVPTNLEGVDLSPSSGNITAPLPAIGLEGVLVTRDDGRTGVVLPSEIAERGLLDAGRSPHLDRDKIAHLLAVRARVPPEDLPSMRAYLFRSDAFVESPAAPLRVVRGMVERPARAAVDELLAAVALGAEYLGRVCAADGRFVYLYHPLDDREDTQYGWLRHAGTTYALLEAYEEFGTPAFLATAERALGYLAAHLHDDTPSHGKYVIDTRDEEQQKVGGAGLALLAFAKHAAVTGKRDRLETMRALARFIVKQQAQDGHFRSNADVERETGKKLKREPVYYPGEAALALMRLYAFDSQPEYLETARRAADWVGQVRDAYVSEDDQEHDHWMSYTYNELYRVTHDGAYLEHAFKIARAIQKKQHRASDAPGAPDWAGTFYEGQTTPASTRLEAYDADIAMARFAGKPDDWLLGPAQEVACSILGQQYRPESAYWLSNPTRAAGGVRESLFVADVRIDYVQHAMSAWLHLARILRDPSYGKTGVPSQDPVR